MEKYYEIFSIKTLKVCSEDKPWFSKSLKILGRKRKREFCKNHKSQKWKDLNSEFIEKCKNEKANYYRNIVHDLKTSNPGRWYSKVKRMTGKDYKNEEINTIEELRGVDNDQQMELIADHYVKVSNLYKPVQYEDFKDYLESNKHLKPPNIGPYKILKTIKKMNTKSATVSGDLPIKIINRFADELTLPLCHIINSCLQAGQYPRLWKEEMVSPVPKVYPPEKLDHLRKISGLMNFSKITDKILTEFLVADMASTCDKTQYGDVGICAAQLGKNAAPDIVKS